MNAALEPVRKSAGRVFAIVLSAFFIGRSEAQLAITEVLSSGSEIMGENGPLNRSDYWELTNFGTNIVDLSQFTFTDDDHPEERLPLVSTEGEHLLIQPFQSIVFVRDNVISNEVQFRDWWGVCLESNTPIRFYRRPGFSRYEDGLVVYDPSDGIVDRVKFNAAERGASFTYDAHTGAFGVRSKAGEGGACWAATLADVGSPGKTAGPVPLRIVLQPESALVYQTLNAELSVEVLGLPPPRYQWFFNGIPIAGATHPRWVVSNFSPGNEGAYAVQISNGVSVLVSSNATLTLNPNVTPPRITAPLSNASAVVNRSARFTFLVSALPLATYEWFTNGVRVVGATDRSLLIPNCRLEMTGMEVRVRARNPLGEVEASARLYVMTKLDLRITEVHASPVRGCEDHNDWFEVTNFGMHEVQMQGYRFDDSEKLTKKAFVLTEQLTVAPQESVIFVNDSAIGSFREWWGAENLPPALKIVAYSGFSLDNDGDILTIWSDSAETKDEIVDSVAFEASHIGVSKYFDPNEAAFDIDSRKGHAGAFNAVECGDIGSPGYIQNPPPRFVDITRDATGAKVRWRAVDGVTYKVMHSRSLHEPWVTLGFVTGTNALAEMVDIEARGAGHRFYRVMESTP